MPAQVVEVARILSRPTSLFSSLGGIDNINSELILYRLATFPYDRDFALRRRHRKVRCAITSLTGNTALLVDLPPRHLTLPLSRSPKPMLFLHLTLFICSS